MLFYFPSNRPGHPYRLVRQDGKHMPETRRHHFDRNGGQQKTRQTADNFQGSRSQDFSAFGNKPETQPCGDAYDKRGKQHSQPVTHLGYL